LASDAFPQNLRRTRIRRRTQQQEQCLVGLNVRVALCHDRGGQPFGERRGFAFKPTVIGKRKLDGRSEQFLLGAEIPIHKDAGHPGRLRNFPNSVAMWEPQIQALSQKYRVIAPELWARRVGAITREDARSF